MARDLTDGFANVAQIDEKVLNRIFSAEFLRLLRHLHTTAYGRELEIWFDTPRLQVTRTGTTGRGALEMSVEMLARLADRWDQAHVTLTARPNLTHEEKQRADGPALIAPVLDFRTVEADAIEVTASEPDYIDPVYRALVVRLKQLSPFPLGPLFPDDGRRFLLREYAVSEEHGRAGILAVLIDDTTGAPLPAPSTMPRRVHGGVLVLVPKETVQQRIGEALKRDGLDRLPKQVPGHSGMRLNSLAIELREGHILISGSVTKEIGPFDTDVTFKAWIRLSVDGGNVHVEVARTQQAGDTLSDVLDLFSGGYITRLLENAIPKAVGSVGGGAFAQVAMFADNLPSDKYAASATASGSIRIYANGLGIPVEITARQAPERLKPAYLHGHVVSREFHVTGCQYGDVIRGSNLRRFVSWQQAIASGFNGCATCQPQYNVAVEGRVRIELTGPPPSADHRPLKLTASYAGSAKRFGVPLGPLSVEFRFTGVQSSSGDVVYAASADGLVPGPWSFSVEWRDWSKAQTVEVARSWNDSAGQRQGHSTFIAGTLGDANLTVTHR